MTAPLPLAGCRVVITRAEDQADPLADRLRALGAEPLLVPSIYTAPSPDHAALLQAVRALDGARWVGATSPSGVRYGWAAVREVWPDGLPPDLGVAAVGPGTAEAFRGEGVEPDFLPSEATGDAFAAELPVARGDRVVLLRSDIARPAIARALRQRRAEVLDAVAYVTRTAARSEDVAAALAAKPAAILFTSPSTVRGFLAGLSSPGALNGAALLPIGPVTARALEDAGLRPTRIPEAYTIEGLLDALLDLCA
jgi:uroporphyrinogen-III synthase